MVPDGWEGAVHNAVCPGCQIAGWHPLCTSLVDRDGQRVDVEAIPREEWDRNTVFRCEYLDLSVSWIEDDDWPDPWQCPECGGTSFEGVHRDYPRSGLSGAAFEVQESDE